VPDADAEQEPAGIRGIDAVERLGDGSGRRSPDVDDAGRDLQSLRRAEQRLDPVQFRGRGSPDSDGAVAQRFDFCCLLRRRAASEYAVAPEVWFGHLCGNSRARMAIPFGAR